MLFLFVFENSFIFLLLCKSHLLTNFGFFVYLSSYLFIYLVNIFWSIPFCVISLFSWIFHTFCNCLFSPIYLCFYFYTYRSPFTKRQNCFMRICKLSYSLCNSCTIRFYVWIRVCQFKFWLSTIVTLIWYNNWLISWRVVSLFDIWAGGWGQNTREMLRVM